MPPAQSTPTLLDKGTGERLCEEVVAGVEICPATHAFNEMRKV